nr:hypothetical protein [Tanacetum cinerariifolium]
MLIAAEHMFPGNVNFIWFDAKYINSLKCSPGGNNSGTNTTIPKTQEKEKDVQVTNNEKKVLTPMPISAYTPKGEASDVFTFYGKKVTTKSNIIRSPFYIRVADVDVALCSEESKVTKYLYLTNHESE